MSTFTVVSVNVSDQKGTSKCPVDQIILKEGWGIIGDAHAGDWHRQVSLLASEDIDMVNRKGFKVSFGDFAENITTTGVELHLLPIGTHLCIGNVLLEISQIGKTCHSDCDIRRLIGDCVMPRRGIFAKVLKEGEVKRGNIGAYDI